MTENESIKELETSIDLAKMCTQNYERKNEIQGYEMAIKALEEVQQYRKIGTVEECREAVEKQKEKKPLIYQRRKYCIVCGEDVGRYFGNFCRHCGQHIDWSDENEQRT